MQGDLSKQLRRSLGALLGSDAKLNQIEAFVRLLVHWNARINLIGARTLEDLIEHHIAESLAASALLPPAPLALADVGSGAGLPGIPLKIARPEIRLFLIERQKRKSVFLRQAVREIGLQGVEVVEQSWESWCRLDSSPRLDCVVSRAALNPEPLIQGAMRLLRPGGRILLFLGRERSVALREYKHASKVGPTGTAPRWIGESRLPGSRGRFLVQLEKP